MDKSTSGEIKKIEIYSFKDKKFRKKNGNAPQPYYIPVNPERISKGFNVGLDNRRAHGKQGTNPRFQSSAPINLQLEFIFDGTGTIQGYKYNSKRSGNQISSEDKKVKNQIQTFIDMAYNINGQIHRPNFLKLHWGKDLVYPCVLSDLSLNYQIFDKGGDPIRVKANATFTEYIDPEEQEQKSRKNSPDLTHLKLTKAGDRLDLLTEDIYDETRFMLQVARANNLTSFRNLEPGLSLRFPPIQKAE